MAGATRSTTILCALRGITTGCVERAPPPACTISILSCEHPRDTRAARAPSRVPRKQPCERRQTTYAPGPGPVTWPPRTPAGFDSPWARPRALRQGSRRVQSTKGARPPPQELESSCHAMLSSNPPLARLSCIHSRACLCALTDHLFALLARRGHHERRVCHRRRHRCRCRHLRRHLRLTLRRRIAARNAAAARCRSRCHRVPQPLLPCAAATTAARCHRRLHVSLAPFGFSAHRLCCCMWPLLLVVPSMPKWARARVRLWSSCGLVDTVVCCLCVFSPKSISPYSPLSPRPTPLPAARR